MKIKYIIAVIALLSCTSFAQELLTNVTWNIGIPVGKTNDYASDVSYRGFTLSGHRFTDRVNSFGLTAGWNVFDEKTYDPINIQGEAGSATISGTQIRSVNVFPILVGYHHYYGNKNEMRAFIGLNTGVYYILQRLDMGVYRIDNDNWHFALAPEAGVLIPFNEEGAVYLGGRYNYAFDSGTALNGAENNFYSYYEVNIGFAFSSRWL